MLLSAAQAGPAGAAPGVVGELLVDHAALAALTAGQWPAHNVSSEPSASSNRTPRYLRPGLPRVNPGSTNGGRGPSLPHQRGELVLDPRHDRPPLAHPLLTEQSRGRGPGHGLSLELPQCVAPGAQSGPDGLLGPGRLAPRDAGCPAAGRSGRGRRAATRWCRWSPRAPSA
jgi:hypothetical protein